MFNIVRLLIRGSFFLDDQVRLPRFLAKMVDVERLETASKMSAHCNPESASFLKNIEYLYEILIKPILEDPIINITGHQTLVFIPCKVKIQNHQNSTLESIDVLIQIL